MLYFFGQSSKIAVQIEQKWNNGPVLEALDSQSKGPRFKTIGGFQGWLSLSSFPGQLNEYQEILGTDW